MKEQSNNYCVILAGGKGRRLWPCSREEQPKQFIDFFGTGRTWLQDTYERFARIIPKDNIFVNTNEAYADLVRQQLPGLHPSRLMAEPIHRGTAPSVAWAAHRIAHFCPDACIAVTPSDLTIIGEERFDRCMERAFDQAAHSDSVFALGVKPTRPEPGYGYIQMGDDVDGCTEKDVYRVKSFTEKPEREFARMFMQSGEFLWNTGMFVANARHLLGQLRRLLPVVLRNYDDTHPTFSCDEEDRFMHANFPSYPNMSLDCGILEKTEDVCVMDCDFGWADLGTWHSLYEARQKGEGDNVTIDSRVVLDNAHGNVIKVPKGRMAVVSGIDNCIIAEEGNVLLVCRKEDSSANVRRLVNEIQMRDGDDFI